MAILKETNMWFILIVVFTFDTCWSSPRMWIKSLALIPKAPAEAYLDLKEGCVQPR